jgi:hypothetical protein
MRTPASGSRYLACTVLTAAVAAPGTLAIASPVLSFVVACAAALGWCIWLERSPA